LFTFNLGLSDIFTYKILIMEDHYRRKRRVRVRIRDHHSLEMLLLCIGYVGFVIGVTLVIFGCYPAGNIKLVYLGLIYLVGSVAVLGARRLVALLSELRKRGLHHHHSPASAPVASASRENIPPSSPADSPGDDCKQQSGEPPSAATR